MAQNSRATRAVIDRDEAQEAMSDIIAERTSNYETITFKEFSKSHQGAHFKSPQYEKFLVLCHKNSRFHAGWMVCPYVLSGHCPVSSGLLKIDTRRGGTNRFGSHLMRHEKCEDKNEQEQHLDRMCRNSIARGAALAVMQDLRPLGFAEDNEGIATYAKAIFEAGQSVPYGVNINSKSYLPTRTAVASAMSKTVEELRSTFGHYLRGHLLGIGGAVSIDGVTLRIQGRHFLDYTLHYLSVCKGRTILEPPKFAIKTTTILFVEGPEVASGANLRAHFDEHLRTSYGVSFNSIQNVFTVVTDGAGAMARMANSSVSSRIAVRDETWMRCYVHILQNSMRSVFKQCPDDPVLSKVADDFKSVKRIVEDAKRNGWNAKLPHGYKLIQDVETRFGTVFLVAERFMKSSSKAWSIIVNENRTVAQNCLESLEKSSPDLTGFYTSFPAIEAICDAFRPVTEAVVEFQATEHPTLHKILPSLQYCKSELARIEVDGLVHREGDTTQRPSVFTMRLCGSMKRELEKIEIHDLWLVACYLFPLLRDMSFWTDPVEREKLKMRAVALARSMCAKIDEANRNGSGNGAGNDSILRTSSIGQRSGVESNCTGDHIPRNKKRKFDLRDQIATSSHHATTEDEVGRYNKTHLGQFGIDENSFLSNPFSVIQFWYARKSMYPKLYKIAVRVFVTPASSSSSERVFSTLNKLVTPDRSTLSSEHIAQIIVGRSLFKFEKC